MRTRRLRILVTARGHVGDMVSSLPALRDLRAAYPDANITVIANEYVRGVLENCPYVDTVIYGFKFAQRSLPSTAVARLSVLTQIGLRFDVALCLRMAPRWGPLLSLVSGAGIRLAYHRSGLPGRLLTNNLGPEPRGQSNRVTNAAVVRALGVEATPRLPRLDWVSEAERKRADALLTENGFTARRFAVLQIASHWGCYEWRSDKWAILAEHLAARHDLKSVVVGTGEEFEHRKFSELAALTKIPVSVQGMTTLPMLFHIVSRASLVVAGDSALTQIALAQQVPSVILFGIEPQSRNGPLAGTEADLMEAVQHWEGPDRAPAPNPHCLFGQSHCHTGNCRENSSFQRTSAEEVCRRADLILERTLSRRLEAVDLTSS